jgi:adenylate cyclase
MSSSRPRILVVDDVDDNVFTLERRLKQFLNPEITSAENGRVALEKLRAQAFDLVLLDIQMPEMDGVAVLDQMKSDMSLRELPVIMVSAVDDFQTVLRCIKLGADDFVQKPFNADLLRARVETALERKRLRDQEGLFLEQLREEKARVNELLHSILPKAIVNELKTNARPQVKRHEDVAVLFCDIVASPNIASAIRRSRSSPSLKRWSLISSKSSKLTALRRSRPSATPLWLRRVCFTTSKTQL